MSNPTINSPNINIHYQLVVDLFSATVSSFLASPFVTILDQAVSCNSSGKRELFQEIKACARAFIHHPIRFCKSPAFLWVWGLYASTYAAHNITETLCVSKDIQASTPKFVSASIVNMSMVLAKDRAFTRMFGIIAPTRLPLQTYGLFACRDLLTVFASFYLPEKITNHQKYAQFICPLAIQFVSTPLHLIGLDLYNRKDATFAQRVEIVKTQYWKSALMRSARIIPAISVGSVCNLSIRNKFKVYDE